MRHARRDAAENIYAQPNQTNLNPPLSPGLIHLRDIALFLSFFEMKELSNVLTGFIIYLNPYTNRSRTNYSVINSCGGPYISATVPNQTVYSNIVIL